MKESSPRDLETKGYLVVRQFLGEPEQDALRQDFAQGTPPEAYPHSFKLVGRRAMAAAWPRMATLLEAVREATALDVDVMNFLTVSHYITTTLAERTSFLHQDFDLDYRLTGDHLQYLNFWIPIVKPEQARSNVCVVPFDALKARSPEAHDRLRGSGGHRLIPKEGRTEVLGNYGEVLLPGEEARPEFVLDFDIESLVETPLLDAGDLLLMRGDLVHRTQDADTLRIAASLRATGSRKTISAARVPKPAPGATKDPATPIYGLLERCFASLGRTEVTIGELERFASGAPSSATAKT